MELHQDPFLVELNLQLAQVHLAEPVLKSLDRANPEAAAESLAGEVDCRPGACAENPGQDRELEHPEQRRGHLSGRR